MICARFLARSAYSQGAQGRRSSVSVSEGSSWRVYLPSGSLLVPHENRRSGVGPPSARALQNRWSRPRRDVRRISRSVPTRATFRACSRAPERWSIGTGNGWRSEHTDAVLRVSDPVLPSMVPVPIGVRSVRGLLIERRRGGTTCAAWVASAAGTRAAAGETLWDQEEPKAVEPSRHLLQMAVEDAGDRSLVVAADSEHAAVVVASLPLDEA
jgi:hypothetical protein